MDDIILTGTDRAEISTLKSFFRHQFKIKDLGSLNYFLGIEVLYSASGVLLHKKKFIHELLRKFHCSDAPPVVCPLSLSVKLKANESVSSPRLEVNRYLVGKLNFLTHTRPDIFFVVQHLSQFMQSPWCASFRCWFPFAEVLEGYC